MESPDATRLFEALLREDPSSFAQAAFRTVAPGEELKWNWHLDAICHQLECVLNGEINRLIIEVPPRSGKSFLASVVFPAFCLGRDPRAKIITASYSNDLAVKFANDSRALMRSLLYQRLFPNLRADPSKNTETEFVTSQRGYRYVTSTGGTLTGRGGELIIVDDPLKPEDAHSDAKRDAANSWFRNTLYTRLNSKADGAIILVMQRLHINDLAGSLRQEDGWTVLSLPAIAEQDEIIAVGCGSVHRRAAGDVLHPEREPLAELMKTKAIVGSYNFSSQYQQQPVPPEGEIVKWRWFGMFRELPCEPRQIVQSWDIAIKPEERNDYSVCTTWAVIHDQYYLLDLVRTRLEFTQLHFEVVELARRWHADVILIEDKASGSALIQHLRSQRVVGVPAPIGINPKDDKQTRMIVATPLIEAGGVHLRENAAWLQDLRRELVQFPCGAFDDQVDSISQFLNWVQDRSGPTFGIVRVIGR
jgi:predicted phage terminase large subunit-like protein